MAANEFRIVYGKNCHRCKEVVPIFQYCGSKDCLKCRDSRVYCHSCFGHICLRSGMTKCEPYRTLCMNCRYVMCEECALFCSTCHTQYCMRCARPKGQGPNIRDLICPSCALACSACGFWFRELEDCVVCDKTICQPCNNGTKCRQKKDAHEKCPHILNEEFEKNCTQ